MSKYDTVKYLIQWNMYNDICIYRSLINFENQFGLMCHSILTSLNGACLLIIVKWKHFHIYYVIRLNKFEF